MIGSIHVTYWVNWFQAYLPILDLRPAPVTFWPYFWGLGQLPNGSTPHISIPSFVHRSTQVCRESHGVHKHRLAFGDIGLEEILVNYGPVWSTGLNFSPGLKISS